MKRELTPTQRKAYEIIFGTVTPADRQLLASWIQQKAGNSEPFQLEIPKLQLNSAEDPMRWQTGARATPPTQITPPYPRH